MTPPLSPEILISMMRQERLTWIDQRAEADDKIRTLDAQIAGAVLVLELQAKAAEAEPEAAASEETPETKAN